VSKRKKQQMEDVPIDKLELFLANNSKKLLLGIAVLLVLFLAGYAFKNMNQAKNDMLVNRLGQNEMLMTLSGGSDEQIDSFLAMANEYPEASGYVYLRVGEVLVTNDKADQAKTHLASVSSQYKELADGLLFDIDPSAVDPSAYTDSSKMNSLWYYRAYLSADSDKKQEILSAFKEKYPKSELLKQIERWDG